MPNQLKTIFLRFRDLVTETDETITKHQSVIKSCGYVWWAWWKKAHESTPLGEFGILSTKAKEETIIIYLVDSGQNKLYKAECNDIVYHDKAPQLSPEVDFTPEYYKTNPYYAWFKFTSIVECDPNEVSQFSYLEPTSLFKQNETNYNLFLNKIVFNIPELVQQNQTIWFVRDFKDGDRENEIVLLDANIVQPYIFSKSYTELSGNTFLWLSDLHFSNNELSVKNTANRTSLTNHIKKLCSEQHFNDISALILSGDITDCCKAEGFEIAKEFISDLNRETYCRLNSDNILVCPGNHDLVRINSNPPENQDPKWFYEETSTSKQFDEFFKDLYHLKPNRFLCSGRKLLSKSGKTIEIVAINTLMLQQYIGFEGHGFVSQEQLDFIEKSMGWDKNDCSSSCRIVVMHHHYCPACLSEKIDFSKPSSVVYDADRLMKWIVKNNVNCILHGHKHNTFFSRISYPLPNDNSIEKLHDVYVISAGGLGAPSTEHKFATITFDTDKIDIKIYKIFPDESSEDLLEQTVSIPL